MIESERADTLESAIAAADRLGFPVAVKTAAPGVQHKSDVGGVRLGVDDPPSLEDAYRDLERELGPWVTLSKMAPPGVEIALGVVRDEQFGPLVLVGAGGVLVEVLNDRRLAMPQLDEARAPGADRRARGPPAPRWRPGPASGKRRCAHASDRRVVLARARPRRASRGAGYEPMSCSPSACVAVDALIIPRSG